MSSHKRFNTAVDETGIGADIRGDGRWMGVSVIPGTNTLVGLTSKNSLYIIKDSNIKSSDEDDATSQVMKRANESENEGITQKKPKIDQ
jgi:hypothetical protein